MISNKHKFIFVHIPKTGGTSIMNSLGEYGLKQYGHTRLSKIYLRENISEDKYKEYFKFATVRNPWDWVISHFSYIKMKKSYWHSDDNSTKYGKHPDYDFVKNLNFKQFLKALQDKKIKSFYVNTPQSYWLDKDIDYIIRFENLQKDFSNVCKNIGIPNIVLPHENKSSRREYADYYDDEAIEIIKKIYWKDIERFNYEFKK